MLAVAHEVAEPSLNLRQMNPLEAQLDYPFADRLPEPGKCIEVAPGLRWLRMPLPFALDHINLWLLRDRVAGRDGWTIIDCGVASDEIMALWERHFSDGMDGLPVLRVLCTHTHPDHVGLAGWLTRRFDAPLWMTLGEYGVGRLWSSRARGDGDPGRVSADHFARHGVAADMVETIRKRNNNNFSALVSEMPPSFVRIGAGERIRIGERDWEVIIGFGHSPEHAALHCEAERLLIAGDMVLPRISTNCSVFELEPLADPLRWYLASLKRFDACADDALVLPSHGRPFRGLKTRIGQLVDHHDERLDIVLRACRERPMSAADAVKVIFGREFDLHQTTFAVGESIAHLHALWYSGQLERHLGQDGVYRFAWPATGAKADAGRGPGSSARPGVPAQPE